METMEINNGVRLHMLNTDRFKTTTLSVYIHNDIDENVSYNALIPRVLRSGSMKLSTPTKVSEYLEDMYGAVFEADAVKKGEIQSIQFYFQFISDRYIKGEGILSSIIDFACDIILNPLIEKGRFKEEFVRFERRNLQQQIASRINDKAQYAVERCMEIVCRGEPFAIYKYGSIEDVENIDEYKLYAHYMDILSTRPIDIFVVGDIENTDVASKLRYRFETVKRNPVRLKGLNINGHVEKPRVIKENMDVNQGKLCIGYRCGIPLTDNLYPALSVYTSILGGGLHSKLFRNVREKQSLAYYVYSGIEKFKALMVINSGIDVANYDKVVDLIGKQVDDMRKGNISDYEMESSIKSLKSDLLGINDNVPLMIDYSLGGMLYGIELTPNNTIAQIERVSKDDIVKVAQKIVLDTTYFIKPNGEE